MDTSYEDKYHELEASNWWFRGRRDIIARLLRRDPRGSELLDIGCSGGIQIQSLSLLGFKELYGIDISRQAIALCKKRGLGRVSLMDASAPSFEEGKFDVILASDVLEHIRDPIPALNRWNRILKPEGKLIVFVPAFSFLWSEHDRANHHFKRYSKGDLVSELSRAGFRIDRVSYWNFTLFLPTALLRMAQRLLHIGQAQDDLKPVNTIINSLLYGLLILENSLLSVLDFPFGVSLFAIARKIGPSNKTMAGRN